MTGTNDTGIQWGCRVPLSEGETWRRKLIAENLYDRTYRPFVEDGFLHIPIVREIDGALQMTFPCSPVREDLARHEQVGGLVILFDDDKEAADQILKNRPNVHTVLYATSPIEGEFRTRRFRVLAGKETTQTIYTEYGRKMIVDLSAAYFSARLSNERRRLLSLMHEGERVLDMFAGVGPFAVTLSGKCRLMVANDLNPQAVELMQQNLRINKIRNVVAMMGDACNLPTLLPEMKFDRIIMNLPFAAYAFLEAAKQLAASKCTIHLYALVERDGEHTADILRVFPQAKITEKYIRSYSPTSWHVVYDIELDS
ncbi:MAG TPA: methyltransferase [Methanocorpusculum sp.]|nr:methyltransferase [Methanocorpusculum sp.]